MLTLSCLCLDCLLLVSCDPEIGGVGQGRKVSMLPISPSLPSTLDSYPLSECLLPFGALGCCLLLGSALNFPSEGVLGRIGCSERGSGEVQKLLALLKLGWSCCDYRIEWDR